MPNQKLQILIVNIHFLDYWVKLLKRYMALVTTAKQGILKYSLPADVAPIKVENQTGKVLIFVQLMGNVHQNT